MSSKLNELQNATVGMTVGVIEVSRKSIDPPKLHLHRTNIRSRWYLCIFVQVVILQPFNYAKNMTQQKQPISLSPVYWYRGVGANMVNMGSCTMIQFAVGGKLQQMVLGGASRHLSLGEEMACGIGAGTVSALVGSPLELIMIQQQRKGGSTAQTIANLAKTPIDITRGFTGAAVREALWTCGYLSIPPVVRRTLMESYPEQFPDNNKARIPAALLGGLFACYLTHPFDTIKTCMQGDIERSMYGTFSQTGAKIWGESKLPGFYRGATFRYGRMVCAVFIMDYMKETIGMMLYPQAFK